MLQRGALTAAFPVVIPVARSNWVLPCGEMGVFWTAGNNRLALSRLMVGNAATPDQVYVSYIDHTIMSNVFDNWLLTVTDSVDSGLKQDRPTCFVANPRAHGKTPVTRHPPGQRGRPRRRLRSGG